MARPGDRWTLVFIGKATRFCEKIWRPEACIPHINRLARNLAFGGKITLKQELTSLEGWVELTKDALILDFHAHHSRAGRSTIPYAVIERVEIVSIAKQGWLSAKKVGSGIRAVRFDRQGYAENAARDRNMMLIPEDDIPLFSELAQTAMERAAGSLSPKATAMDKLRSGMYKKGSDGEPLMIRGAAPQTGGTIIGVADIHLSDSVISKGTDVHPLRRVYAKVSAGTTHDPVDRRVSATRVVVGATLAGTAGATIGAIAQKKVSGGPRRTIVLTVTGPGFEWVDEIPPALETTARNLAVEINRRAGAQ